MSNTVPLHLGTKISDISQARLVAESAFTTTATPSLDSVPVVVRRRKIIVNGEAEGESLECKADDGVGRSPKVYRLESSQVGDLEVVVDPDAATQQAKDASLPCADGRPIDSHRRRRQKKHGGVTIIRPEPPSSSELAERTRKAVERYELLMAEIRKLDHQVEAARMKEVAEAARWIRKAIAVYNLDADDLGL